MAAPFRQIADMNRKLGAHREHVRNCGKSSPICKCGGGDAQSPRFALGDVRLRWRGRVTDRCILNETLTASSIPSMQYSPSNKISVHANNSSSGSLWGSKCQGSRDLMSRRLVSFERSVGMLSRNERSEWSSNK
jgi:hypothetical protein